ncbi:MAG: 30S ribosomal protein S6 [Verrucomicrobiota bacterium]|nr:30S ribosomal protein S6 [Verrucomicrobiota bacterium]MCC6823711.1 30S ribosomal protein S6 [Limisphaerales bacterium]
MKRYEGLFILNSAAKEDGIKDTLDKISADITAAGGKVETVQKMDRKAYARVADKKHTAGFYANVIFTSAPAAIAALRSKFALNEEVFRVIFTSSPEPKPAK